MSLTRLALVRRFCIYTKFAVIALLATTCKTPAPPSSTVAGAGVRDALTVANICLGNRQILPNDGEALNPKIHVDLEANGLTLGNAYWFGVLSAAAYNRGADWIDEFLTEIRTRASARAPRNIKFFDLTVPQSDGTPESREAQAWFTRFFQDTQVLWAESDTGVVVAFRGTEPDRWQDVLTDALIFHRPMGTFSGKWIVPPRPFEQRGAEDSFSFETSAHLGFSLALDQIIPKLETMMVKDKFTYMTMEGILDRLRTLNERELETALASITSWKPQVPDNIQLAIKKKIVKSWAEIRKAEEAVGKFHMNRIERESILVPLRPTWQHKPKKIWLTGHSLGGALANVFAHHLLRYGYNFHGSYTYGGPRPANNGFVRELSIRATMLGVQKNMIRFVNQNDLVARIPPPVGAVVIPDRWEHTRGARYLTFDDTSPYKVRLWIDGEDVPTLLPQAPIYTRQGNGRDEVRRWGEIRDRQAAIATQAHMGLQSEVAMQNLRVLFPLYLIELPRGDAMSWVANHSMPQYIDHIGRYAFDGETSRCPPQTAEATPAPVGQR